MDVQPNIIRNFKLGLYMTCDTQVTDNSHEKVPLLTKNMNNKR